MARFHGKAADVFVDEFDFGGVMTAFEIEIDNALSDVTAFNDSDMTFVEGKAQFAFNLSGLWSLTSPAYDAEMFIDLTTTARRVGLYPPGATTDGNRGYEAKTLITEDQIPTQIGTAVLLNVNWRGNTPIIRSWVLHKDTVLAATKTGTAYQIGALSSTQTMVAVVRLFAAPGGSGDNDLVITIESDNDSGMAGASNRMTFSTIDQTSSALIEEKTLAGVQSDDWWRVVATYSGGGSRTFNVLITMGIRPTDG